jgi:histidine triad (HIT) family protein
MASDCIFCRIAAGDIPADIVLSDDSVVAFRDTNPQAPTHVLVIPRQHVASAQELGADHAALLSRLFGAMSEIAGDEELGSGYRIVTNVGPDAGQTVQHLHFHLLGGRALEWPPG